MTMTLSVHWNMRLKIMNKIIERRKCRVQGVIIENNKILLLEHSFKNRRFWALPGGGVEKNENLEQALKREIKEETGLIAEIDQKLFEQDVRNIPPYFYEKKVTFLLRIIGGQLLLGEEPETHGFASLFSIISFKWFKFDEISDNIDNNTLYEIKKIFDILHLN